MTPDPFVLEVQPPVANDRGLLRWVVHDSRARRYSAPRSVRLPTTASLFKRGDTPIFNQQDIGKCTACAGLGVLSSTPGYKGKAWSDDDTTQLYREETWLDDSVIPGRYEPEDTGSTGWYSFKALQKRGLVKTYQHAFGINAALNVLEVRPISIGVNWYESFDYPDKNGYLKPPRRGEQPVGGHQFLARGQSPHEHNVFCDNSWATDWGLDGSFRMTWTLFDRLLREQGDVTYPTLVG